MTKVITVGSATMDVFVECDEANIVSVCTKDSNSDFMSYPYGSKIDISNFASNVGGGGVNTACNFGNLGFETSAIFKVGRDIYSEGIFNFFKTQNVNLDSSIQDETISTGFSIILVSFQGDRTVLAHRGANALINKNDIDFNAIKNSDLIYIAPLNGESNKVLEPIVDFAHKNDVKICFNADGYIDYLCDLIEESVTMFPDADGVFLDIISQTECCCPACIRDMLANGLDPEKSLDRRKMARRVMLNYYRRTFEAVRKHSDTMTIFHNAGHITMGDTEILPYFSHLELESLPTGGWGYDHYPMSAAYSRKLGLEFLGMTGKFHTTWGEFGGFKHPNALRYECAAMLANSSKCSIGDQLHPCGKLDESTYKIIGAAYKEVKVKEPWCDNVTSPADIAILGAEPHMNEEDKIAGNSYPDSSIGASRLMLELHQFFDFVTLDMDLSQYKVLIIPDIIRLTESEFKIVKLLMC